MFNLYGFIDYECLFGWRCVRNNWNSGEYNCVCFMFVLCLWGIIGVFKNDKELTGQLNQYQLYCKDESTQLKLANVDVIIVDIDTVLMIYMIK